VGAWAGVRLEFIRLGKPTETGHIESFNGRFREECLNAQAFFSLAEERRIIEVWRRDYNTVRPHSSLAGMSPEEYRRAVKGENTEVATKNLSPVTWRGKVRVPGLARATPEGYRKSSKMCGLRETIRPESQLSTGYSARQGSTSFDVYLKRRLKRVRPLLKF